MQAQFVGDLAQHHRAHGQFAMREKTLLPLDDGAADAQDGVKALLDVLDEPARLLHARSQRGMALALEQAGVGLVNAQARHGLLVQAHLQTRQRALPHAPHNDIGHDVVVWRGLEAPPGFGI